MPFEEFRDLFFGGLFGGLWEGVKIMAPYFIGFILICIIIAVIKKLLRKKKK